MPYFPMCVSLKGRPVLLVGNGPQIRDKAEKLAPFEAALCFLETLKEEDLACAPAFVVAGDLPLPEAERTAALCRAKGIPVNVVDQPLLSTFAFPALLLRGEITLSISTGGKAPAAAACLKGRLAALLPEKTEQIVDWLAAERLRLRSTLPPAACALAMQKITAGAFEKGDILTPREYQSLLEKTE